MDDLSSLLLAAIEETEADARERRGVWPSPSVQDNGAVWLHIKRGGNAVVVHYAYPGAGFGDMADLRAWADAERGQTDEAVLRRCAADRRRLERHAPAEPGIGHFVSARFKDPSARICSHCSHDGDWGAVEFPCPDFVDLMDSYGLTDHQEGEE